MIKLDFDYMVKLAKDNPGRFEQERTEMVNNFIMSVPQRSQFVLTGIQARVNRVVRTSGTPMNACIIISRMMWDGFNELNNGAFLMLDNLREALKGKPNE